MVTMEKKKTVYILGAGFSREAGAPVQTHIIREALKLNAKDSSCFDEDKFRKFKQFIQEQLNIAEKDLDNTDLEDIFTPLDRCLSENAQFRGIDLGQIPAIRECAFYVIGRTIQLMLNETCKSKDYIDYFAQYLVQESSVRSNSEYRERDPVSVISTNWDILLDNSIYKTLQHPKYHGVVDYCCHISSLEAGDETIKPGLEVLGRGGFNVKLLKLHGSLNWLQCPRCSRLYTTFNEKIALHPKLRKYQPCRHCNTNFPESAYKHRLSPNLIMPTYIKDLSNPQYRIIWQNAGIEIAEAEKLVFIGYSLPAADFEMRQLLSRMVRKSAKIVVVDYVDPDDDNRDKEKELKGAKEHWRKFFGSRDLAFRFDGASSYIKEITKI